MYFGNAQKEDIKAISALYKAAIGTDGCTWNENYPNEEITQGDLERGDLFCLKNDSGEIIGAISVDDDALVDALPCWSADKKPAAELARLVVKEKYQNQGVARKLLEYAMEELRKRGYKGMHFLVSPEHKKALRSYAKLSFVRCGECYLYEHDWLCYEKGLEKEGEQINGIAE